MAKRQNISIGTRAGNKRIERAIPLFMRQFGMARDQATATAIRLESIGRLEVSGEPIPQTQRGQRVPPLAVLGALRAMKKDRQPSKTVVREGIEMTTNDPFLARKQMTKTKRRRRK